jgi:methylenetetrahydrofolate dehydrogenase (NADP+) / methenyltetrahydrofolate cyclohydrolase
VTSAIIDGRAIAHVLKGDLAREIERLRHDGAAIGLATVQVGGDYSADAYERRLCRLAEQLDVRFERHALPADTTQAELLDVIAELNWRPEVSGILILRPLPHHIDESLVCQSINAGKDIEAVHPENAGLLALGVPRYVPSTAASVFHLLDTWLDAAGESRPDFYHRSLIVVVGRSNNVGKPCVSLGYDRQAAVESLDEWTSKTVGLGRHTRRADVLIVAAGAPGLVRAQDVSENAVVIDVGINPRTGPDGRVHVVGDVDFASVSARARAITPVPGGVGPVTDVWLMHNTVLAARSQAGMPAPAAGRLFGSYRSLQEASQ